jgi:hypothetical protein
VKFLPKEDMEWWKGFGSGISIGILLGLIIGIFKY